jgi:hypothetical protein
MWRHSYKGGETTRLRDGPYIGVVWQNYWGGWAFLVRRRKQSKVAYQGVAHSREAAQRRVHELIEGVQR